MMDEDDDVLDLGAGDAGVDEPMGGAASAPAAAEGEPKLPAGPTETELRLARRVMELEKERDEFQVCGISSGWIGILTIAGTAPDCSPTTTSRPSTR